jgi:hypothetical protein
LTTAIFYFVVSQCPADVPGKRFAMLNRLRAVRADARPQASPADACGPAVKRRAVAGYLAGVVVNGDREALVGIASRPRLENQIGANDPEGFQIGRAGGAFLLFLKPALFFCGIGAGGGAILGLGHGASKRGQIA